jgi:hypothetical protein
MSALGFDFLVCCGRPMNALKSAYPISSAFVISLFVNTLVGLKESEMGCSLDLDEIGHHLLINGALDSQESMI